MKEGYSIQFLGATETVTGSRTLVRVDDYSLLIDCGLFQGPKEIRERNWQSFTNAEKVNSVVLTHAHIDHSGYLPKFVAEGFEGPIYCSDATKALCEVMLIDAAHIQEEDARFANRTKHSRHDPALPLYTREDAEDAIGLLKDVKDNQWVQLHPRLQMRLLPSGHILGSTFVQLSIQVNEQENRLITFSGDIGHHRSHVIKGPVDVLESDALVLESTYGDRRQTRRDPKEALSHIINKVIGRGGTLVIPAFAVGRSQEILHLVADLEEKGEIPPVPVYLDSPMAMEATKIYMDHPGWLQREVQAGQVVPPVSPKSFHAVSDAEESMLLCMNDEPKIVISAAGMLNGGRVLHHLKQRLPDRRNGVIFVGYQASGTKGLLLKSGLPEIRIHHQLVTIEAEIFVVEGLSAHGDCEDIMNWLGQFQRFPKTIYLNHGEENAQRALKYLIQSHHDCEVVIPRFNEKYEMK